MLERRQRIQFVTGLLCHLKSFSHDICFHFVAYCCLPFLSHLPSSLYPSHFLIRPLRLRLPFDPFSGPLIPHSPTESPLSDMWPMSLRQQQTAETKHGTRPTEVLLHREEECWYLACCPRRRQEDLQENRQNTPPHIHIVSNMCTHPHRGGGRGVCPHRQKELGFLASFTLFCFVLPLLPVSHMVSGHWCGFVAMEMISVLPNISSHFP